MSRAGEIPLEPPLVRAPSTVPAREDRSYLGYIGAALAFALAGGFALAVWMPLAGTDVLPGVERTPRLVQAHGWLQLQGWAGLFVAGMAIRVVPRFVGRRPLPARVTVPLLGLLAAPLAVRLGVLPWVDGGAARAAALATGWTTAAGCAGVGGVLAVTFWRGKRGSEAWRLFIGAGAAWWLAWAPLAAWWGWRAANGGGLAPAAFDDALAWAVMLGPIGNFILGVQSRAVPVFFGRRPPDARALAGPWLLVNAGAGACVLGMALDGTAAARAAGAGLALGGAGLCWGLPIAGAVRGRAHRLRPRARPAAKFVLAANLAGMAAGALMLLAGAAMALEGGYAAAPLRDAARHLFGLGPITMLILGMARLIAPVFAVARTESRGAGFREHAPFWLLAAALVVRAGAGLASGTASYDAWMHASAAAGVLAWLAIAVFAADVLTAARKEAQNLAAIEAAAPGGKPQAEEGRVQ
ncbi:hypothetical protein [Tepidiforma thermophila]|uniref:NnrS family protein n=1 Tax=Tepidiforma thermophila (strain KCTC 52669 / CGMCC 1.13589 / G233) TaxID=2761530 RepID=A0A2A9HAT5_TEPT2|nr:hypothetical protein [Tepidiforma thermophila]PFG73054.1 hypothetical protein A9A59_0247 [Tepidiforma thermophila]